MDLSYFSFITATTPSTASSSSISTQTVLLLITSTGFTAVVVAIITAVVNKRKIKAEEVNIISQAAGAIVDRLEKENVRLTKDLGIAVNRISDLELIEANRKEQAELHYDQLKVHRDYDDRLIQQIKDLGGTPEVPPPLFMLS